MAKKKRRKKSRKSAGKAAKCKVVSIRGKRRRLCFKRKRVKGCMRFVISSNRPA